MTEKNRNKIKSGKIFCKNLKNIWKMGMHKFKPARGNIHKRFNNLKFVIKNKNPN